MARRKPDRRAWTPNQIVAHNIAKARLMRGWTQDEAGERIAAHLGHRLSPASWSAIERSVDGGRIREFSADELVAFARGFDLPIGWFLTPPPVDDGIGVAVPDAKAGGMDPHELIDLVLGTPETLEPWRQVLLTWPSMASLLRIHPDGTATNAGRVDQDVHPRLRDLAHLHAQTLLREQFGDLDAAREVLTGLAGLLQALDDLTPDNPATHGPTATGSGTTTDETTAAGTADKTARAGTRTKPRARGSATEH